jgi:exosome complex component CSL4
LFKRRQDVRAVEKDQVQMEKCFRPGDIVLAQVLSLGDAQAYHLSTAKNELGVVLAKTRPGRVAMVPISWQQMQCPKTGQFEFRKCTIDFV